MIRDPAWPVLRSVVRQWTGIALGERSAGSSLRALRRVCARFQSPSPTQFLATLAAGDAAARDALIDEITIGATWFMRERDGLDRMVRGCVAHATATGVRSVRVWSAGCATGQEAYSIAMLLLEADLRPNVLGTDVNGAFLRVASQGSYAARDLRNVPPALAARYFERAARGTYRVGSALSGAVAFAKHNLSKEPSPRLDRHRFDVVVCRNVLIYFDAWDAVAISRNLAAACRPGGTVVLGAVEQPLVDMTGRRDEAAAAAPASARAPAPALVQPDRRRTESASRRVALRAALDAVLTDADAVAVADQLAAANPLCAKANLLRGLALKRAGRLREAVEAFRNAAFLAADAWLAPYQLGVCLQELGDAPGAVSAFKRAMSALAAHGPSGLPDHTDPHDAVARTVADSCWQRIRSIAEVAS